MQKVILFLLPLFLGGGCAFANGHTPEQLAYRVIIIIMIRQIHRTYFKN